MSEYLRPLWLGGGVRRDVLEIVEQAVREKAEVYVGPIRHGLMDVANAAHAELTRAEPKPMSDLV